MLATLDAAGSGEGHPDGAGSPTGDVGGTSRTGSEIGNELDVGGTSLTGADTGIDGEPDARTSRRLGTASATGGTARSAATGSANGGGTGADGAGIGIDGAGVDSVVVAAETGGGKADASGADAAGLGWVWSVQMLPSHQRMSAGLSASAYHPGAAELMSPPSR